MSNGRTTTRPATARAPGRKKPAASLAKYRKDATGEPFCFEVETDRVIEIGRPTGKRLMDIAEKYAGIDPNNPAGLNPREQLADLLGDAYDEVMPVLEAEDFGVMLAFLKDLIEFFGLGEALASLG